jgi:hypothetical protein
MPKNGVIPGQTLVFVGVVYPAGWFIMAYLPAVPDEPVSAFETEYWTDNWIGALSGL